MKKWISVVAVLGLLLCLSFTSVQAQWTYLNVFPNDTISFSSGINNTIAVTPNGHVWFAPYINGSDSIQVSGGAYKRTAQLLEYSSTGVRLSNYEYFTYNASVDTFFYPSTGYGMTTDHEGNLIVLKGSDVLRKINYQTGVQMAKATDPLAGYASSLTSPGVDDADEVFITSVAPTTNVGPAALASDFSSVVATIDTGMGGQYSRVTSVTPDGKDVYVHQYTLKGTVHYHSASGTLGAYTIVDTLFKGLVIETAAWRPGTKQLWVGSGSTGGGISDPPYQGYAWYGFDMTNPDAPVLQDSIVWNGHTGVVLPNGVGPDSIVNDPRPRGIAFSPNGNTAYVAAFNPGRGFIEKFQKVGTAVQPEEASVPVGYTLGQNYPNPFNPTTQITFSIAKSGMTTLIVYDLLGREVATLVNGERTAGRYSVPFDASRLSSGTYIYELRSGDTHLVKKMMLLK